MLVSLYFEFFPNITVTVLIFHSLSRDLSEITHECQFHLTGSFFTFQHLDPYKIKRVAVVFGISEGWLLAFRY